MTVVSVTPLGGEDTVTVPVSQKIMSTMRALCLKTTLNTMFLPHG